MKKLLLFFFLLTAFFSYGQDTLLNKYTKPNNTYGLIYNRVYTPYAFTPALDTLTDAPNGSIAFKAHVMYYKDTAWKIFVGSGSAADGNNYPTSAAFTNNSVTISRNGLTAITAAWDSSLYHSIGFYDGRYVGSNLYTADGALTGNRSITGNYSLSFGTTINKLAVFNAYSVGNNTVFGSNNTIQATGTNTITSQTLNLEGTTGTYLLGLPNSSDTTLFKPIGINTSGQIKKIDSWFGGAGGSDGNNYPNSTTFSNNTIVIGRNGLTDLTASWDSTKYHSVSYYDGRYQPAGSYLTGNQTISFAPTGDVTGSTSGSTSLTPALTIGAGKVTNSMLAGSIAASKLVGTDIVLAESQVTNLTSDLAAKQATLVSGTNIKTINGNSLLGSGDLTISGGAGVTDGNKGDITASSSGATWTINNSAVTLAKTTGIEGSFTETVQEFTGSTSMSITLSNTPKSGKAEMYYLNGVVIKSSNISRTGTSVTLSGFTMETSDVITAKYSY